MKTLHVITSLSQGGAEAVLCGLVSATAQEIDTVVVSLTDEGVYGPRLRQFGVRVETLDMPRGRVTWAGVGKLWRLLKETKPHIVQTWMHRANMMGGVMARLAGINGVIWGIHNSTLDENTSSFLTRFVARICARLSGWLPAGIACCSKKSALIHRALGYPA